MADLTTIILTYNEEQNIKECIESAKAISQRIVVVDSGSTDKTTKIAGELGAEIMVHTMTPFLQSKQFIYAVENANVTTQWILRLDADERLTKESAAELEDLCQKNALTDINGIVLRFEVEFMGKKLRHGGIYPFRKMVCYKRDKGYMEDVDMDEHIVLSEGKSVEARFDSEHHDYKDLTRWIEKHNLYSDREVSEYFKRLNPDTKTTSMEKLNRSAKIKRFIKIKIYYKLPGGFRAWAYYIYRYILRGGFLDGREGRIFAFLQAYWYRFLVDAKIREKEINR